MENPKSLSATKSYVLALADERNQIDDAVVGRAILGLMTRPENGPKTSFTAELSPFAFEIPIDLLEASARRVLSKAGLSNPSYVGIESYPGGDKVTISIPGPKLSNPHTQKTILAQFQDAAARAAQLGI